MANSVVITNGTDSVTLTTSAGSGIRLVSFRPPTSNRTAVRSGPGPGVIGQRTTSSTLGDATCDLEIRIESPPAVTPRFGAVVAPDTNGVANQYIALVRLLEQARLWEERRAGTPVRLKVQRDQETNASYWTITGATLGESSGPDLWMLLETANSQLTLKLTLTVEPVAHEATVRTSASPVSVTTAPGVGNLLTIGSVIGGDVEAPLAIKVKKTSIGNNWTMAWLAQLASVPDLSDYSGTVDGTALNGAAQTQSYTGTILTFTAAGGYTIDVSKQYPIRVMLRMKVTAGTASKVQARIRVNLGSSSGTPQFTGQWVPFAGVANNYFLMDLGRIPVFAGFQNRVFQSSVSYFNTIEVQTSDGSAATVVLDYSEYLSYLGFIRLDGLAVAQNDAIYYEDIYTSESGAYAAPRQAPQVYQALEATGVYEQGANRYGRLARIAPSSTAYLWFQAQSATLHQIGDTAQLNMSHLQLYSLGLRGAG